jgi:RNA polymerase-binding transcription factor DksA
METNASVQSGRGGSSIGLPEGATSPMPGCAAPLCGSDRCAKAAATGISQSAGTFSLVMTERFPEPTSLADLLTAERARTLDHIAALTRDRNRIIESSALKGVIDEHDAEGAATDFERSQIEALLDQARRHLSDFDRALRRLEEGQYGTCESCGRPIAPDRLAARPEASTCITCAAAE